MIRKGKSVFLLSGMAIAIMSLSTGAMADEAADTKAEIRVLKNQVETLMKKLEQLSTKEEKTAAKQEKMEAQTASAASSGGAGSLLKNMEFYGNLDLSIDSTTKGLQDHYPSAASDPVGTTGAMPAISSNLSYIGLRGKRDLTNGLAGVFQLETQLDISATSGTVNTTSNQDTVVKGGLTSRNSFLGLAGDFGAVKIGKTDAPYKTSTARMNPFVGMLGDYSVIMGNTGGDNRVEFGTRLDHAIWYESPVMSGFSFNLLVAPGQNRNDQNLVQAAGESSCTGGNTTPCNDGSYGTATSLNIAYEKGPLYVTLAYENHSKVNRTGDNPNPGLNDNLFLSDETATKLGVQYKFPTRTTVSAIYEDMRRGTSPTDALQGNMNIDERTRTGYWLAATQELTPKDLLSFGWAHANATPGDPGTYNVAQSANPNNAADMYTVAYRHYLDKQTSWYANYAVTANHDAAHYDLGAGGRGVTTDCHDGADANNVHCFAGGRLQGISVGMNYKF